MFQEGKIAVGEFPLRAVFGVAGDELHAANVVPAPHSTQVAVEARLVLSLIHIYDLVKNHHANLVCGPDAYLNLPEMIAAVEVGQPAIDVQLSTTETYRDVVPRRIGGNRVSAFVSIMRRCV